MKNTNKLLPGFNLALGYSLFYLSLIVLLPVSALFIQATNLSLSEFWQIVSDPRLIAAYKLTFGSAFVAAFVNSFFGLILCWILVRYNFFGKKIIDALIDLPFALPTSIAGITMANLYNNDGLIGAKLAKFNINIAYSRIAIIISLVFISIPFVIRTLEPIVRDMETELEEAALSLGASRMQFLRLIMFPNLLPAIFTGFSLAFARAIGEYGSVIFVAGNIPGHSEIVSLLINIKLEQYDYNGATAVAIVMLAISFSLLLIINIIQKWSLKLSKK